MRSKRGCIVARYNSQTHETTATCTNWSHAYVVNMGRLTIHERLRVITLFSRGHSVSSIRERLAEENVSISLKGLYNLLKKYREKQIILSRLTPSKKASDNWHTATYMHVCPFSDLYMFSALRLLVTSVLILHGH